MNTLVTFASTFFITGLLSALIGYLASHIDPLIAVIIWTYPFTIIVPLYFLHKDGKSNKFISDYVIHQTVSLLLLVVIFVAMWYFIKGAPKGDNLLVPQLKATGVWLIAAIVFFGVGKYFKFN